LETSSKQEAKARASPHELPTVYCLVENHQGYSNLCQLLTLSHQDMPKGEGASEVDWLLEHAAGLRLVIPVPEHPALLFPLLSASVLGVKQQSVHIESALHWSELQRLANGFEGRVAVAAVRRLDGYDPQRDQLAERWAEALGAPILASNRPRYHLPSRKALADVLHCVRLGTTLDRAGTQLCVNTEASLRSEAEMLKLFADHPEWVEETAHFAAPLCFNMGELDYQFPCELSAGESADARLERLTWEGAARRYPEGMPEAVAEQIRKELKLIERLGVAPYFLSTWEVVELARARRILCQGRGSAANSAVCYVLGITAVDPARSKLLFERFLSEERAEPPDIDIDFEHERREEVIQDIYERYGRDRAAMVSEVICYRGKSALREVGKAFGLSLEQVDRLSSAITHWDTAEVSDRRLVEYGFDVGDPRLRQVVMLARALEGFPRHLSIHVGGFVLSATPLHHVAPVEPARMPGRTVVPWDKDDMEALGFFKIDVLGLGMLTAVRKALELIEADGALPALPSVDPRAPRPGVGQPWKAREAADSALGRGNAERAFDPLEAITHIPPEDPQVYAMVSRADTVGVFQIESRAQMAMLPRLRPECFYDLVIEVALVRPGPIQGGMVHPYLRRRNGEEPVSAPHPSLWPILERTLGVPLFQEQVMQISIVGAGYSGGEADQLRRDMAAWKKTGRLMRHRERLLQGFSRQGISRQFGEALFEQIKGFGDYGFPESHAASFALIVYSSAWEKAYFPAHFACALLNSQPMGFYSPSSIVRDAQAHGVLVRDVCVMHSNWDSSLEWATAEEASEVPPEQDAPGSSASAQRIPRQIPGYGAWLSPPNPDSDPLEAAARRRVLRLGLRLVKGMGEETALRIVAARQEKPFDSLHDLVLRASLKKDEVEALAEAGALEALVGGRRQALWRARAPRSGELFEPVELQEAQVALPALRAPEQLLLDYGRKGLSVTDHPMCHVRRALRARGVLSSEQLQDVAHGAKVKVAGVVLSRQQPGTASGVVFITLEDETGIMNLVLYAKIFEQFRLIARHSTLLLAHGKIERQVTPPKATSLAASQSVPIIHVVVSAVERLDRPGGFVSASRDFH
ncbi:MAG: error-prone DNA polymerase, partial [Polyangiaceae bacterium]